MFKQFLISTLLKAASLILAKYAPSPSLPVPTVPIPVGPRPRRTATQMHKEFSTELATLMLIPTDSRTSSQDKQIARLVAWINAYRSKSVLPSVD